MPELPIADRVVEIIHLARNEALRLRHGQVNSGHLLLALIEEGQGVAIHILRNLGTDLDQLRREVEKSLCQFQMGEASVGEPSISTDTKMSFRYASEVAYYFSGDRFVIDTEHLLLGFLQVRRGIAARVLRRAGANYAKVWDEMCRVLGVPPAIVKLRRPVPSHVSVGPFGRSALGLSALASSVALGAFAVILIDELRPAVGWRLVVLHVVIDLLAVASIFMFLLAVSFSNYWRRTDSLLRWIMPKGGLATAILLAAFFVIAGIVDPGMRVAYAVEAAIIALALLILNVRKRLRARRSAPPQSES
jgi:hypothetical protein